MFGELMRWNPSQELSSWHRDIDDLFGRFLGRPETSLGGYVPRIETFRKATSTSFDLIFQVLIRRMFRSMQKVMFFRFLGNEKLRRRGLSRNFLRQV